MKKEGQIGGKKVKKIIQDINRKLLNKIINNLEETFKNMEGNFNKETEVLKKAKQNLGIKTTKGGIICRQDHAE